MSALISQADLAGPDYFDVPESTVAKWHRDYQWPHVRVGRRIRYTPEQVAEILRRHTVKPERVKGLPGQTARSAKRSA